MRRWRPPRSILRPLPGPWQYTASASSVRTLSGRACHPCTCTGNTKLQRQRAALKVQVSCACCGLHHKCVLNRCAPMHPGPSCLLASWAVNPPAQSMEGTSLSGCCILCNDITAASFAFAHLTGHRGRHLCCLGVTAQAHCLSGAPKQGNQFKGCFGTRTELSVEASSALQSHSETGI